MMQRLRDDRGVAMIMVIVLGFVSALIVGTALLTASSGLRQAVTSQRSLSAYDAAFAGLQDYLARVNADPKYEAYGNKTAPFTISSNSAATVSAPTDFNPALGAGGAVLASLPGDTSRWPGAVVPGSGSTARFWYEIDNSAYKATGIVRVRATGASGVQTRTLLASLRVRGFVDFAYFTDLEMQDPQVSGDNASTCSVYYPRPSSCTAAPIRFLPDDAISGDVFSNDRMIICAASISGQITTYYSGSPLYGTEGCSKTKTITNIRHGDKLDLPASNTSMRSDAKCLYTGPTRITYNQDGTMTVVSPWTRYTAVVSGVGSNANAAACGSTSALQSTQGAKVNQLDGEALFVQNVPASTSDPNYSASPPVSSLTCIDTSGKTTTASNGAGWQLKDANATIRYPLTNEVPATIQFGVQSSTWSSTLPAYGCRDGDLYVQGLVTVQTTAAAENYVYDTGDITYADK